MQLDAERVKARMTAVGIRTQNDLADRLGVTFVTVSRWMTGRVWPEGDNLAALLDVLDCTVDDIVIYTKVVALVAEPNGGAVGAVV